MKKILLSIIFSTICYNFCFANDLTYVYTKDGVNFAIVNRGDTSELTMPQIDYFVQANKNRHSKYWLRVKHLAINSLKKLKKN